MSLDEIKYRIPKINETDLISTFFNDVVDNSFSMYSTEAKNDYKKSWGSEKIAERLTNKNGLLFTAWQNNSPIGLVSGPLPEGGVGTIIWLLVKEGFRNQKIGSQLLSYAYIYYQKNGCHKIKLTAPSEAAKNFYLKQGMQIEGFHPQHWWSVDFWALGMPITK